MGRAWLAVLFACALASPSRAAPGAPAPPSAPAPPPTRTRVIPSFAGAGATVNLGWSSLPGATKYHVTWQSAGGAADEQWSPDATFMREHVASGRYTLQIRAATADGSERALMTFVYDVVDVAAIPPGSAAPQAPTRGAYAIGTQFTSEGIACTFGGHSSAEHVPSAPNAARAATAGLGMLHCGDALVAPIVIAPVIVSAKEAPLPRGQTTTVHVTVASVAALGEHLTITAIGDAKAGPAVRTAFGLDVPLTIAADGQAAALAVIGGGLELGRVGFELEDPAPPPPPPPTTPGPNWAAFDVGALAGGFIPTANATSAHAPAIGHPTSSRDVVSGGPMFGPRVGLYPVPRLGVEAETALLTLSTDRGNRIATLVARGQVAVRVLDAAWFGARVYAGAGVIRTLQDSLSSTPSASGEVHYGLALAAEATDSVAFRLDALDMVSTSRDAGYAHSLEIELAVVARLGRRDRL